MPSISSQASNLSHSPAFGNAEKHHCYHFNYQFKLGHFIPIPTSRYSKIESGVSNISFHHLPSFSVLILAGPPAMLYPWFLFPMVPMALAQRRLDGPATTTTMPRPGAAEVCFEACKTQGFCCNDYNIGSNLVIQGDHIMGGGWGYSTRIYR